MVVHRHSECHNHHKQLQLQFCKFSGGNCCSKSTVFNRPGVAVAVLQSPPLLTDSLTDPFVQNLQDTVNPNLLELGS